MMQGTKSSIGTSAVQLSATSFSIRYKSLLVKADSANTGTVYVGDATVTAGTTDATDGYSLKAGESVTLPPQTIGITDVNQVWVIGSAVSQKVHWAVDLDEVTPASPSLGGGGGPATIADGQDVCEGATTDAANTTGTIGTISGKLRGLVAILASIWDSMNGFLRVGVNYIGGVPFAIGPQVANASISVVTVPQFAYVTPNTAFTSSGYTVVSDSLIDRNQGLGLAVGYMVKEVGGVNGVTFKLQASIDGANWDDDGGEIPVAASSYVTAFGTSSGHRYYRIAIKDTVANNHGQVNAVGYAH